MKRLLVLLLVFLVLPIALAEPSISKEVIKETEKGEYFNVILNVDTDSVEKMDLVEFIPSEWKIVEWKIDPDVKVDFESMKQDFLGEERNANHWTFESVPEEFQIVYKIYAEEEGNFEFITLWLHPEGFDSFSEDLKVTKEAQSASSNSPLTGFAVNPPIEPEQAMEQVQLLNLANVKNSFSVVQEMIFGLSY